MPYIKVNADNTVTLGGALLHTSDESEGWFLYEGEVYEYSKWNEAESKVVPNVPPLASLVERVSVYVNTAAKSIGYDDITSAVSYNGDSINAVYGIQAERLKKFRTEVWDYFFMLYDLGQKGEELIDPLTFIDNFPKFESEVTVADLARAKRDSALAESDLLVLADVWLLHSPERQKAIAEYREALRNLPQQEGFPETITWPTKP